MMVNHLTFESPCVQTNSYDDYRSVSTDHPWQSRFGSINYGYIILEATYVAFLAVPQCNGFWVLPSGDSRVCELDITILLRFNKYVSSSSSLHGPFSIAMLNDKKAFQKLVRQKKHCLSQSIVTNKPDGWLVPNLGCGQFVRPREWQEFGWFLRFNFLGVRNFQPVDLPFYMCFIVFLLSIRTSDEWLQID